MITVGLVILAGISFTLMSRTEETGRGSTFGLCITPKGHLRTSYEPVTCRWQA